MIDSVLVIGFGGPTRPDEIMPFLLRVAEGRAIPEERLRQVALHYEAVGGRSPYNEQTESLAREVGRALERSGSPLPIYVGMRNWQPLLADTVARMAAEGRRRAAGVILAAHRSEGTWQRYMRDVERALETAGEGPEVAYLDPWFDEPGFLEAAARRIEETGGHHRGRWPRDVPLLLTAHSIPLGMAEGSPYVSDLLASCRGVAGILQVSDWQLAYQSRGGDPRTPWLGPDICDLLRERASAGVREVVVHAIGFLSDHVEVLYDLDVEAAGVARSLGIRLHRTPCVNAHPAFAAMLAGRIARLASGPR